jgi:hypothetical protein
MDMQRLKNLKLAVPFQPFVIILQDGRRLPVDAPHQVGLSPDGSRLGVLAENGMTLVWPDNVKDVDVLVAARSH